MKDAGLDGYTAIIKSKNGRFTLCIPELGVFAEDDTLEGAHRKLIEKKNNVLQDFAEMDYPPPMPQSNVFHQFRAFEIIVVALMIFGLVTSFVISSKFLRAVEGGLETVTTGFEDLKIQVNLLHNSVSMNEKGLRNVALGKPATMSSNLTSYNTKASAGVDGIKSNPKNGWGFITVNTENPYPWWQVDLESVRDISEIRVFNSNLSPHRARTLKIFLSNDASNWTEVFANDGKIFDGAVNPEDYLKVSLSNTHARYVRLQISEKEHLHLNEIEVWSKVK